MLSASQQICLVQYFLQCSFTHSLIPWNFAFQKRFKMYPWPIVVASAKVLCSVKAHELLNKWANDWSYMFACIYDCILFWQCCTVQSRSLTTLHLMPWAGACSVLRGSRISTEWNQRLSFTGTSNLPSMLLYHFSHHTVLPHVTGTPM